MDVIERLTKQGKDLGYEGETLQTFVKEQQIELRDERKAMREAERERREAENAKREAEAKLERERREADAKLERERREADAKLERETLELMERIEAQKREIEKEAREAAREAREAETAKREAEAKFEHDKREAEAKMERDKRKAEELFKREELEIMERIEREKHDIEREKIEAAEKQREADERQRKEEREAAERHDQLLCDMEKAKLALEQDRINSQQFQQQRDYEFKCQLQDRQHEDELERLEAQKALTQPRETIKAKAPKIPAFNEGKDEMDSYLLRFERYATAQKWEPDTWATGLSALLQGKALDVYALMPKEDALNYDKLKVALLKRYELTEEGFKRKYKKCRPENGETFQQFTTRMKSYFTRWIDMASIEKSYEGLQDLILREQLTFICNRDLELFLREREPKSLEQASKLADQYKEARYVDIVSLTYKNNERSRSRSNSESRSRSMSTIMRGPNQGNQGYPRVRCYNCGGPHVRRFCPQLKQGIMNAGAVDYRRSRSPTRKVTFQTQEPEVPKEETAKDGNQNTEPKVCGACLILTDAVNYSQATINEREMVKTSVGSPIKVSSVSSLSEMTTVQGFVGEKPVEVLRDTGCSGVIVSKDLVPESAYTGRSQTIVMVDYSSRVVPEVKVSIDTPYYKGEVLALCVEKTLVGLIIGNIPGARERNNPDINWVPALAVQTRAQAKREGVTSKLKTPNIIDRTITPTQVSKAQKDDVSLTITRSRCEANETIGKATFFKRNDLLYRKFSSPNVEQGKIFEQLIVPEQYRELVMKLAHESILTGHLSVTSSVHKVLAEYYWPGIYRDVKRFVQSCKVCKSLLHEGKSDRNLTNGESILKGEEGGLQQQQMNETSQVSMKKEDPTSMVSEGQGIMYSGTFMVKVGACQTFQGGEYSRKQKDTLQKQMKSHVKETLDNVTSANVSNLQMEQNGNEALTEGRPMGDGRRTGDMYEDGKVRFCNITDECRTSPDEFDRKDMIVWIFSFMAIMVMMMVSCIGKWTCTLGKIFRKGTECCSKRIRGWLLTGCCIEWCGISIVLLYIMDSLPIYKFSEAMIQIMWTYVVMLDVVEGVSLISEVPDRWLRPGKRKFTMDLNGSIANHGKAIWRYVLKRSAERSKVTLREF